MGVGGRGNSPPPPSLSPRNHRMQSSSDILHPSSLNTRCGEGGGRFRVVGGGEGGGITANLARGQKGQILRGGGGRRKGSLGEMANTASREH